MSKYVAVAKSRMTRGKGKSGDPYLAAAYRRSNPWVREELVQRFDSALQRIAVTGLNDASDGRAGEVDSIDPYLEASLEVCGLTEAFSSARSVVLGADELGARILSAAANKPWYPKGYEEWQDGIAFKYLNGGPDCGYGCSYWNYNAISRNGCPSGFYVEVNITDSSGRVVDWSNESYPSLPPMKPALVQFRTYADSARSFDVNELDCR